MRVVSGERPDWSRPLTARVEGLLDGGAASARYAWLSLPRGPDGEPFDLVARPRRPGRWATPTPGTRVEVLAWPLHGSDDDRLRTLLDAGTAPQWPEPPGGEVLWVLG